MNNRVQRHGEKISKDIRDLISLRYHTITKVINNEFWESNSGILHSFYVGSYGRNTAINTSDIDILVELPSDLFDQYDKWKGNSQSQLLQAVRSAVLKTYPRSDVRADGQVVKINFSDEMLFEIVPAFKNCDGKYKYPNSNAGGNWKSTNPKAEQEAMAQKNKNSNGLLYDTCKHIRMIRDRNFSSLHLSGIVIDSFVYWSIGGWRWPNGDEFPTQKVEKYERVLLDYYNQTKISKGKEIYAPGSRDIVDTKLSFECLGKILNIMAKDQ